MAQAKAPGQTVVDIVAGGTAARTERVLSAATMRRLRTDPDFWRGFHRARPDLARKHTVVEDPTRPGGWCVA